MNAVSAKGQRCSHDERCQNEATRWVYEKGCWFPVCESCKSRSLGDKANAINWHVRRDERNGRHTP